MKKLAVILPTYNAAPYLKDSIDSILNQTYTDFDLYIYDDCSTDTSKELILEYKDSRVYYQLNEVNYGIAKTLNRGLEELLPYYEFIARMDADDWSFPDRFEKQLKYLEENQEITMCGTQGYWLKNMSQNPVTAWEYPLNYEYIKCLLLFGSSFGHSSVIFRSTHFKKHSLKYNETLKTSQDYDLWTQMVSLGLKVANLPFFLMKYRILENSNHRSILNREKHIDLNTQIISKYWSEFNIVLTPQQVYEYYFQSNLLSKSEFVAKLIILIEAFNKLYLDNAPSLNSNDRRKFRYLLVRKILKYWKLTNFSRVNISIWILIIRKVKFVNKFKLIKSLLK